MTDTKERESVSPEEDNSDVEEQGAEVNEAQDESTDGEADGSEEPKDEGEGRDASHEESDEPGEEDRSEAVSAKTEAAEEANHDEDEHHHPNYVKIWGILVVLLVVSVLGPMLGHPVITLITAFGIALVKAYLVARNFMHLNIEPRYVVYLLVTCVAFMVLLYAGVAPDVMRHSGQQWENTAAQNEVRRAMDEIAQ